MNDAAVIAELEPLSVALRAWGMCTRIESALDTTFLKVWHLRLPEVGLCVGVRMEPDPDGDPAAWFTLTEGLLVPCRDRERAPGEVLRLMWPALALAAAHA